MIEIFDLGNSIEFEDGDNPTATLRFAAIGSADLEDVSLAVLATAPVRFRGLVRQAPRFSQKSAFHWECEYRYGKRKKKEPGDWRYRFSTSGGSQRIVQSLETVHKYNLRGSEPAPDYKGRIGVTDSGDEGCDVVVPALNFNIGFTFSEGSLSPAYAVQLAAMTGSVNNAPFWGYAAGEVLFRGAEGDLSSAGALNLDYAFSASSNRDDLMFLGKTIEKKGHEYLWFRSKLERDTGSGTVTVSSAYAYVERIYREVDFSMIGIGTDWT